LSIQPVTPMPPPAVPPAIPPSDSVPIGQRDVPGGSGSAPVAKQAEESTRAVAASNAAPDVTTVAGAAGATGAAAATSTNTAAVVAGGAIAATGAVAATASSAAPAAVPISTAPAAVPSNNAAAGAAGSSALSLDGPREAKVGEEFPVTVRLSTDQSITRLRAQLRFDSSALQLLSADTGDMVPAAAGNPKVQTRGGGAQLDVSTTADEPVQGSGSLMVVNFRAMQPRPASDISAMLNVLGASGAAVANSSAAPLKMAILAAQ